MRRELDSIRRICDLIFLIHGIKMKRGIGRVKGGKLWPKGRQWIGQEVKRKEVEKWGKDWYPGKVIWHFQ